MESFLQRYRNLIALVVVLAIQVVALATQIKRPADPRRPQGNQVRLIRVWLVTAFTPFEKLFVNAGSSVRGVWSNYMYLRGVRQENRNLRAEIEQLRVERSRLAEGAEEAHRLQALLNFKERFIGKTVAAEVIGTSGVESSRAIYIGRGSRDGMREDMPVITPDGIVGKIKEVYPASSQVIEITDATSGAGVVLKASRLRGVLKGGTGGLPEITNIMADEKVQPGDEVITSGGDSVFPPGLPVGTVARVSTDSEGSFLVIAVKPAASLNRLEEVLVVTRIESAAPTTEDASGLSEDQRVAEKRAERLPTVDTNAQPTISDEEPARPQPPARPVHPDRFSTPTGNSTTVSSGTGSSVTGARKTKGTKNKLPGTQPTPSPDNVQAQPQSTSTGADSHDATSHDASSHETTTTPENTDTTKGASPQ